MRLAQVFHLRVTFPQSCQAYGASAQSDFADALISVLSLASRLSQFPRSWSVLPAVCGRISQWCLGKKSAVMFPAWSPDPPDCTSSGVEMDAVGCQSPVPLSVWLLKRILFLLISCSAINLMILHVHCLQGRNNLARLWGLPVSSISHCKLLSCHSGFKPF